MINKLPAVALAALLLSACGDKTQTTTPDSPSDIAATALQIAQSSLIVDTHIDVPYRLRKEMDDISRATVSGDFDYPRAVRGGLNAPFMSIFTPAELETEGRSREVAEALIDMVEGFARKWPDNFALALSTDDVRRHFAEGLIALPMGMENGSPIEGDLANVRYFYDRGIRYITPTHGKTNHISDSSYDDNKQWNGLSPFGVEVITEMNHIGIMVDVSHVSDEAFWQILELSDVPVIASHSSARHFTPGFERNMDDAMIVALADQGGVIQINFGSSFITAEAQAYVDARKDAREIYGERHPEIEKDDLEKTHSPIYAREHGPLPYADIENVLDHFDHVVAIAGVDHVGIGSDFDGVGDSLPIGLKDVSTYPALIEGLLRRGYSEPDVRKVLGDNLLRVWKAAEDYAATMSSKT